MLSSCPAAFVSACGTTVPRKKTITMEVAAMPISAAGKRGDTISPSALSNKNKNKQTRTVPKMGTAAHVACTVMTTPRRRGCCSTGNTSVFVLQCCCCCLAVFNSACRTMTPTKMPTAKEEAQELPCPREKPTDNNHPATRAEKGGGGG